MAISYPAVLDVRVEKEVAWTERDTLIYALGVGVGADPLDRQELPYVYGPDVQALPTMPSIFSGAGHVLKKIGAEYAMVLHGEQSVILHRPFPAQGNAKSVLRVANVYDKGQGKGAVLVFEITLSDDKGPLVTLMSTVVARGDGGCGGSDRAQPPVHELPTRAPDYELDFPTRPDQALLYRLSGDYNPLHADPDVAAKANFPQPILHGLCTYAITARAVLQAIANYDASRILSHAARFSAPVFPGETISVDLWRDGAVVSFQARVKARNTIVIRNGKSELRSA